MASTWQIRCDTGFSAVARPAGSPGEPPTNPRLRFAAPGATRWTPAPRAQTYSPSKVETPERGEVAPGPKGRHWVGPAVRPDHDSKRTGAPKVRHSIFAT